MDININLTVKAPELTEAINNLAKAKLPVTHGADGTSFFIKGKELTNLSAEDRKRLTDMTEAFLNKKYTDKEAPAHKAKKPAAKKEAAEKPAEKTATKAADTKIDETDGKLLPLEQDQLDEASKRAELKSIAVEKARAGKNNEVKKIIEDTGAEKLSDIPVDKLADAIKKVKAL